MSENKRDYEVGRGKPPVPSRFDKGCSAIRVDRAGRPDSCPIQSYRRRSYRRSASLAGSSLTVANGNSPPRGVKITEHSTIIGVF
jgi:hypothetical protein